MPSIMKCIFAPGAVLALGLLLLPAVTAHADEDGHGPDAWRVTGVAEFDVLNARMGPGTQYLIIDDFMAGEDGLQQVTCVPVVPFAYWEELRPEERDALPARWCLMRSADGVARGWVAGTHLAEGTAGAEAAQPLRDSALMLPRAEALVRELYAAQLAALRGAGPAPLTDDTLLHEFFSSDVIRAVRRDGLDFDPLFNAQDFDGEVLAVAPDPDAAMLRGTVCIRVRFRNFGREQVARVFLRVDTARHGKPLRVVAIEHDGVTFPS